jgi:hypothetical protein
VELVSVSEPFVFFPNTFSLRALVADGSDAEFRKR